MAEHYFAATARGWAVANTRKGAIKKVALDFTEEHLAFIGALCLVVKVHAPIKSEYEIDNWLPVGVRLSEQERLKIVNHSGTTRAA